MMGMQMKIGILAIVFGVLHLIAGLVMSGLIIDNVNKQGGKIGCFDADDIIIKPAHGPNTTEIPADSATPWPAVTNSAAVPSKVSSAYTGANVVGKVCGCLNNIMTMVYWIVLVGIALGLVGVGAIRGAYS